MYAACIINAGFVLRAIRSDWIRIFHLIRRRPTDLNCTEVLYERRRICRPRVYLIEIAPRSVEGIQKVRGLEGERRHRDYLSASLHETRGIPR